MAPVSIQPPVLQPSTQGISELIATDAAPIEVATLDFPLLDFPGADLGELDASLNVNLDKGDPNPNAFVLLVPRDLVLVLEQYPKCLLRDDYASPVLHRILYDQDIPDMTTLPRTSMAVCCGSAMETADGARFAQRTMEVERQRLIQSYPAYTCMQQWDALHAMLVYSILELRASNSSSADNDWKQKSYSQGLKAPFLAKMAKSLIRSHRQDQKTDLMSVSRSNSQNLEHWAVAETTRRTIFLANIVHYFGHYNLETGSPSLYYEPLDDELILNMPLPCSHVLWTARTEMDWKLTVEYCEQNSSSLEDLSTALYLNPGCLTLKQVLESYPRENLQTMLSPNIVGLGGSDELRSLIILCALEQFA